MELQMAKEILAEIFGAWPGEVKEMVQMRLEEGGWMKEKRGSAVASDVLPGGVDMVRRIKSLMMSGKDGVEVVSANSESILDLKTKEGYIKLSLNGKIYKIEVRHSTPRTLQVC